MDKEKILKACDHTILGVDATWEDVKQVLDDGMKYGVASVCISPAWVARARVYANNLPITTVIGFPSGCTTTASKVFEAKDAIAKGADEIDMVIHVGALKDGRDQDVLDEINAVKEACGDHILKVIVETCLLTEEEKVRITKIVSESKADYIKTSTGFSTGGATFEDVKLFADNVSNGTLIKAAGGISSLEDGEKFLELGASRLGTSRIVKAVKAEE